MKRSAHRQGALVASNFGSVTSPRPQEARAAAHHRARPQLESREMHGECGSRRDPPAGSSLPLAGEANLLVMPTLDAGTSPSPAEDGLRRPHIGHPAPRRARHILRRRHGAPHVNMTRSRSPTANGPRGRSKACSKGNGLPRHQLAPSGRPDQARPGWCDRGRRAAAYQVAVKAVPSRTISHLPFIVGCATTPHAPVFGTTSRGRPKPARVWEHMAASHI